jgi:hypothetical protein
MKRVVRQKESVYQDSFSRRTTRDNCHGYLKATVGTVQAPAEICSRIDRNDFGGTGARQLSQSGALRGVQRAHVCAAVCTILPVVELSRAGHSTHLTRVTPPYFGAGRFVHFQERQAYVRAGLVL